MKKDTPKRDRDSDNTHISSKSTKITATNTIRTDRYSSGGGGGGGDDSDEEFVDFIIDKIIKTINLMTNNSAFVGKI